MAHLSDQYVHATSDLILEAVPVASVLAGLQATLASHKHSSLYPLILTRLVRELPLRLKEQTPMVTLAKESDLAAYTDYIASELTALKAPSDYAIEYDENLIGGATIRYQSTQIDSSYKHVLKNLYKNIITS